MKEINKTEKIIITGDNKRYINKLLLSLTNLEHNGNRLQILAATDEGATQMLLKENPDTKLVLLYCSMECYDSAYCILVYIKEDLKTDTLTVIISDKAADILRQEIAKYKYAPDNVIPNQDINRIKLCIHTHLDNYDRRIGAKISKNTIRQDIEYRMGNGKVISKVLDCVEKYAEIDKPFLIEGDTGTGKELIANYWYKLSSLKKLTIVNCATLSKELAISDMFGSVKGAFTGAENKEGFVKVSDGGLLFLDEFNSLPFDIQTKFLRLMEYGDYYKVGDTVVQKANVRIIAAGNKSFKELVKKGEFRLDLYKRFIDTVYVPTLKERIEDIDFFIDRFISEENKALGKTESISDEAQILLIRHDWTGNVRDLKNFIEKLVIMVRPDEYSNKYIIQPQLVQDFFL
jgi:transcriptional regulator with PAS, ATPase and Fis domain